MTAALAEHYDTVGPLDRPFEAAVADLDEGTRTRIGAIVLLGTEGIGARVLAQLPGVAMLCCLGSGYDGIDLAVAAELGVTVTHSPGANAASVADLALALAIECARDIPRLRRHLHAGEWNGLAGARPEGRPGLTDRNLGIYGLGMIGRKIAVRALACEMHVGYHGRHRYVDVAYPHFGSLRELAAWSDVLVLAARADAANHHIVDREVLRALGGGSYLVNVARGSLVDEVALIEALQQGTIAGAGLDVYESEPRPPAALLALPNVALTPHIGGVTTEARTNMESTVLANLAAHFAGLPPPYPVQRRRH